MKKIFILALCVMTMIVNFTSCKKGPEDPFISLKSRDSKITGIWLLASSQSDYTVETNSTDSIYYINDKSVYNESFDGSDMTTIINNDEDGNSQGGTYSFSSTTTIVDGYDQQLTIEKDGTYSLVTTVSKKSYEYTDSEGELITDNFSNEDSVVTIAGHWRWADAKKKKTWLVLDDVGHYLLRLSNKEMKWERSWTEMVDESAPDEDDKWSNIGAASHTWSKL